MYLFYKITKYVHFLPCLRFFPTYQSLNQTHPTQNLHRHERKEFQMQLPHYLSECNNQNIHVLTWVTACGISISGPSSSSARSLWISVCSTASSLSAVPSLILCEREREKTREREREKKEGDRWRERERERDRGVRQKDRGRESEGERERESV